MPPRKMPKKDYWNAKFEKLVEFYEEHGHCCVPREYRGGLGPWVYAQRAAYRAFKTGEKTWTNIKLTQERIDLLNSIGFSWTSSGVIRNGARKKAELRLQMAVDAMHAAERGEEPSKTPIMKAASTYKSSASFSCSNNNSSSSPHSVSMSQHNNYEAPEHHNTDVAATKFSSHDEEGGRGSGDEHDHDEYDYDESNLPVLTV